MLSFTQDLRYALRQLRKSPGYTVVTIATLALGIGANTAIFLLTYSILLRSLPVPRPGELVHYRFTKGDRDINFNYPLYESLRAHQPATTGVFATSNDEIALQNNTGAADQIRALLATGSILRVLELRPYGGRGFAESAGERGQPLELEALLSYDFWRKHFNADPHILGRALLLGRSHTAVTVIGVLPPGFDGIYTESHIDLLLPLSFERVIDGKFAMIDEPGAFGFTVMGRLKPGQSVASASLPWLLPPISSPMKPIRSNKSSMSISSAVAIGWTQSRAAPENPGSALSTASLCSLSKRCAR